MNIFKFLKRSNKNKKLDELIKKYYKIQELRIEILNLYENVEKYKPYLKDDIDGKNKLLICIREMADIANDELLKIQCEVNNINKKDACGNIHLIK